MQYYINVRMCEKILIYNPEERAKREPVLGERTGSLRFQRGNCIAEQSFIYVIAEKAVRRRGNCVEA